MALSNGWVGYVQRSYAQMKSSIIASMVQKVPELTDHTESNVLVRMISVWSGLMEMLGYYVDNLGREAYLATCELYSSVVIFAKSFDYRIKSSSAASADITFALNINAPSNITIPQGTRLLTPLGVPFYTTQNLTITTGNRYGTVSAINRVQVVAENIGDTNALNTPYLITGQPSTGSDIVDTALSLTVGGISYAFVDSFAYSNSTDKVFSTYIDKNKQLYIIFGDGINGLVPPTTQPILVTYFVTNGYDANVGPNLINIIATPPSLPTGVVLTCYNVSTASGGYGVETLTDVKKNIPIAFKTNYRAVTGKDYAQLAKLVSGVAQSAAEFNCGKTVEVYIAAHGGGTPSSDLLKTVELYFEDKRMITTLVKAYAAGIVQVVLEIDIVAKSSYINTEVHDAIETNLLSLLSVENQQVKGSVYLGDIYQTVESTDGVQHSVVKKFTLKPAAIPIGGSDELTWDRLVLSGSTAILNWQIITLNSTTYQLYRSGTFLGTYTFGTDYTVTELSFNVTYTGYAVSSMWSFKTYPIQNSIVLDDISIPIGEAGNFTLNVTGGI